MRCLLLELWLLLQEHRFGKPVLGSIAASIQVSRLGNQPISIDEMRKKSLMKAMMLAAGCYKVDAVDQNNAQMSHAHRWQTPSRTI